MPFATGDRGPGDDLKARGQEAGAPGEPDGSNHGLRDGGRNGDGEELDGPLGAVRGQWDGRGWPERIERRPVSSGCSRRVLEWLGPIGSTGAGLEGDEGSGLSDSATEAPFVGSKEVDGTFVRGEPGSLPVLSVGRWKHGGVGAGLGSMSRTANLHHTTKDYGKDIKALAVITRMLWLYAVATVSRGVKSKAVDYINYNRPVAFALEHPAAEAGKAQSLWDTSMWKDFRQEMEMSMVTFNQEPMGAKTTSLTTLGTNVYYLMGLDGVGLDGIEDRGQQSSEGGVWSPGLVTALVTAIRFWRVRPRLHPSLMAMTAEQWKRHVQSGHADYHRDCLTCVTSRGTGRRHARVHHPDMFNLTIDMAGPVKAGLDVSSKGTMGRGLKYLFVAKYLFPKEFAKAYSGREPPSGHGLDASLEVQAQGEEPRGPDDKELARPSLLPPREEAKRGSWES